MRVIVVGMGVQGEKRRRFAGADFVAAVDTEKPVADFRSVQTVPLEKFDAALVCVPDEAKIEILSYLLGSGKHVLVEKPLVGKDGAIKKLEQLAQKNKAVCYVAYNHRFEPHFVRMRNLIGSGELGRLYHCRLFYGNGTARLVRDSAWRDKGAGVIDDLGSHLLDSARFWFGDTGGDFSLVSCQRFENRAPDHAVFAAPNAKPALECEVTLLSWRNHFTCDLFAEKGSAHISSLCKWGPADFIRRTRVLPSGKPEEDKVTLAQEDPTWAAEYAHFKALCAGGHKTDLSNDIWLNRTLRDLDAQAAKVAA